MADVSDPAIAEAYEDVRNDKTETNWLLIGYEDTKKIVFKQKGSGGLDELKPLFQEAECQYAFVKFVTGDSESKRAKFLFISWVGEKVSPLRRAKVSVDKPAVFQVIKNFAAAVHCTVPDDVDEEKFRTILVKAGGANYSGNVMGV